MKKGIALLLAVLLSVVIAPMALAAEEVSTNYFKETFGEPQAVAEQSLATSTTAGYGNWRLAADNLSTANNEGTKINIKKESESNNVMHMVRTQRASGLAHLEAGQDLTGIPTTDIIKLTFRMKCALNNHNVFFRGVFNALRSDFVRLESNNYKFEPANAEQSAKLNTPGVWNTYELVIDYNLNTTTLYIDDLQIGDASNEVIQIKHIGFLQQRDQNFVQGDVYIDDISIDHIVKVASYKADKLLYTTESGAFTATAQSGGLLKQAYITKADTSSGNGTAFFACYDEDNRLLSVKSVAFTASDFDDENSALLTVDMSLPDNTNFSGGSTKVFFFDSLTSLNPMEEPTEFDIPADKTPTLYLLGDSVVANYNSTLFPRAGIGMMLGDYFDGVTVSNYSISGAGTDTMLGLEGADYDHKYKWDAVRNSVSAGDYVYIPLGANDCSDAIGTTNYINNLDVIVSTLHEKGVNVIIGSFCIWHIYDSDGTLSVTFDEAGNYVTTDIFVDKNGEDYLAAQREYVANKKAAGTPGFTSVDAAARTAELLGKDAAPTGDSVRYFIEDAYHNWDSSYSSDSRATASRYNPETGDVVARNDGVHLSLYGAASFAKEIAKEIAKLDIPLADYVTNLDKTINYPYLEFKYSDE